MSEMVPINLRLPKELEEKVSNISSKNSLSTAEYIRSSIIKALLRLNVLPNIALVDMLRKISRTKIINKKKEIEDLRKLRGKIWQEKYGSSS